MSEPGVDFLLFRRRSRSFHRPRMQERPRGGLLQCFDPFSPPPPPSRRAGGGFLRGFDAVCAISTSLAWKSEPEVDFLALDAVRAPSPTIELAGDGFSGVSAPFSPPPPPLCASASWGGFSGGSTPFATTSSELGLQ